MERDDDLTPARSSLLTQQKDWDAPEGWRRFFHTYRRLVYNMGVRSDMTMADAGAHNVAQESVIDVTRKMRRFNYSPAIGSSKSWPWQLTRWLINDQPKERTEVGRANPKAADGAARTSTVERVPDPNSLAADLSISLVVQKEKGACLCQ